MANDRNARNRTVADPSRSTGAYSINAGDEPPRRRPGWLLPLLVLLGLLLLLGLLFGLLNRNHDKNKGRPSLRQPGHQCPAVGRLHRHRHRWRGHGGRRRSAAGWWPVGAPLSSGSPGGDLTQYAGQDATAKGVLVQSVPADEGFWVGSSETDRSGSS